MMDNTYIIFASDHGEMLGDHGLYTKSLPYEASIRVPLIVTGPGINGRHTSDALVELIDVNPTICSLAGLPPQDGIDARSFGDILLNYVQTHREEAVSAIRNFRLIRTQDYKLIQHENDITELYDLRNDPDELHSVSKDHPEVVRDLQSRLGPRFQFLP
jgi:choline-sulfatase